MTSKTTTLTQQREDLQHFPEYPPRDDMQNWLHLYETAEARAADLEEELRRLRGE